MTHPFFPNLDGPFALSAVSQAAFFPVDDFNLITIMPSGTFAGLNLTFEASLDSTNGVDGTWFSVTGIRTNSVVTAEAASGVIASSAYGWTFVCATYNWLRARVTAIASGTCNMIGQRTMTGVAPVMFPGSQPTGTIATPATVTSAARTALATNNATVSKATAGTVFSVQVANYSAAVRYVKLYNKATAPTVGTDVPLMTIVVPAGSFVNVDFGALGTRFSAGIGFGMTTGLADTDNTAVVAGDLKMILNYI